MLTAETQVEGEARRPLAPGVTRHGNTCPERPPPERSEDYAQALYVVRATGEVAG
ncbi:predicted protein [Streptomyces viridosporus ATCC 14672]|uniref:Predicted protein n=1 Tax=Streptomyces viridosporus (strain ATCC 14672 / DSM 40746 / JCM 4963 / KCTC 9882 / NRRL B-12104 / FH 1290) TaxID=566461 RepID=D6A346_STRV1|nr:predicted protein [Streptomyces viridosporus ATCC 14672]